MQAFESRQVDRHFAHLTADGASMPTPATMPTSLSPRSALLVRASRSCRAMLLGTGRSSLPLARPILSISQGSPDSLTIFKTYSSQFASLSQLPPPLRRVSACTDTVMRSSVDTDLASVALDGCGFLNRRDEAQPPRPAAAENLEGGLGPSYGFAHGKRSCR